MNKLMDARLVQNLVHRDPRRSPSSSESLNSEQSISGLRTTGTRKPKSLRARTRRLLVVRFRDNGG
jgi:hypothetical protein